MRHRMRWWVTGMAVAAGVMGAMALASTPTGMPLAGGATGNWAQVHKHWSMIERSEAAHHGATSMVDEKDAPGQT